MRNKSIRERFCFWLNLDKEDDFIIADMITELKQDRKFTSTIRDGIRLICDLRAGRVGVLFELFPWVRAEFVAGVQSDISPLEKKLNRIEALVTETAVNGNGVAGLKQLAATVEDDDEITPLEIKKDTSVDASENFLKSVMALQ